MKKIISVFLTVFFISVGYAYDSDFDVSAGRIETLEIKEVEITDVLRMLAEQFNLNVVISDKVIGKISVKFSNVSVEEAIDALVSINGYAYTKKGTVIKVTTPEEIERESQERGLHPR